LRHHMAQRRIFETRSLAASLPAMSLMGPTLAGEPVELGADMV